MEKIEEMESANLDCDKNLDFILDSVCKKVVPNWNPNLLNEVLIKLSHLLGGNYTKSNQICQSSSYHLNQSETIVNDEVSNMGPLQGLSYLQQISTTPPQQVLRGDQLSFSHSTCS